MTERYLRKPSHLIRQLTLGLAAGAMGFYLLSNAIPVPKRTTPAAIATAPTPLLSTASKPSQPQASRVSVWVLADALGWPLPGLVSEGDYVARQQPIVDGVTSPAQTSAAQPASSTVPDPKPEARAPVAESKAATAESVVVSTPKAKPQSAKPGSVTLTPTQVLAQKESSHLSVQLMGASRLDAIERFVVSNRLTGKVWVYRTQLHGNPWYVVLKGDHANQTLAMAAIRKLPAALLAAKPWPKSFAQVKKELKQQGMTP